MQNTSLMPQPTISQLAISYGQKRATQPAATTLRLAVFAGLFIGLAYIFYITVTTGAQNMPWGVTQLLGGLAFSTGLILVVVCGAELFTSSILMTVALIHRRITLPRMAQTWLITFLGNLIGAALLATLVVLADIGALNNGSWGNHVVHVAQHKLSHSWQQAFALGVLCNFLVCLATWMSLSSRSTPGKAALMILPVALFVSAGFEHSIANLFIVPLAWFLDPSQSISITQFMHANLLPVLLGNIIGGALLLGLAHNPTTSSAISKHQEHTMNIFQLNAIKQKCALDVMHTGTLCISASTPLASCMQTISTYGLSALLVTNDRGQLVGAVSQEDILRFHWAQALDDRKWTANDMARPCNTATPDTKLIDVIGRLTVDEEKLYPVTDRGILTSTYAPFEQRLKTASAIQTVVAVIDAGQPIGMITSQQIIAQFRPEHVPKKAAIAS